MHITSDEAVRVEIDKIQDIDNILYLHGNVNGTKIRIASLPNGEFKRNCVYNLELVSLRDLLIRYNAIPVNYLHTDLSDYAVGINDTTILSLEYKRYKDTYLTPEMEVKVIEVLEQVPMLQR
jgi:hypothetical protein